jgi:hypothetical protein
MKSSTARLAVIGVAAVSLAGVAAPAIAGTRPSKVHAAATTLTVKSTKNPTKGDHYKATVVATLRSHHRAISGEAVELYERKGSGKSWTDTGQNQTTGDDGKVTFNFTQTAVNEQYQLRFAGDPAATPPLKKSHSGSISIHRARSGGQQSA